MKDKIQLLAIIIGSKIMIQNMIIGRRFSHIVECFIYVCRRDCLYFDGTVYTINQGAKAIAIISLLQLLYVNCDIVANCTA